MPHPVMGNTRDYGRYIKALITPFSGAITIGRMDLRFRPYEVHKQCQLSAPKALIAPILGIGSLEIAR